MQWQRFRFSRLTLLLCAVLSIAVAGPSQAGDGRWTPVGPGGGTVSSLAVDPSTPGTLWAAMENGVYKSTDGGTTWTWKTGGDFRAIAIDPVHPSTLYASGGKVLRSEDGGETWSVALDMDDLIPSLAVAPGSGTVYAVVDGLLESSGLMRSADGGKSWKNVLGTWLRQVVVDPSRPRSVYAIEASFSYYGLRKSTNGGETWAQVGPAGVGVVAVAPSRQGTLYAAAGKLVYRSTDGGASWTAGVGVPIRVVKTLVVDPETPTTVYAGGDYGLSAGDGDYGFAVSTDGGEHWAPQVNGLPLGASLQALAFGAGTPRILHAGMVSLGVAQTQDGGESWHYGLQLGLSAAGHLMEIDPVRAGTFYVSAASGQTLRTTDGGRTWAPFATNLDNGYVHDLVVDRFHPAILYAGTSYGVFRSDDDGASWVQLDDQGSYVLAVADGGNAILSGECGLRQSADGGRTWREVISCFAGDDLRVSPLRLLALPGRPTVHAVIFVGNQNADQHVYLYTSRSNGRVWSQGSEAFDVAVCLAHPTTVYAASYDGLRRSDDGGRHWTSLDAGLPTLYVAVDPRNPQIVYASRTTVQRSTDGGLTWTDADQGLDGRATYAKLFADPTTPGHFFVEDGYTGGLFEATFPSP